MQEIVTIFVKNEAETKNLASALARYAVAGDFIRLEGTLGLGKTTFARAFIRALSGEADLAVPSPTFNLMQTYDETRLPVVHVDAYRMVDASELDMLDLSTYYENGVTLMEWCGNVEQALPVYTPPERHIMESEIGDFLTVELADVEGQPDQRKITLKAHGTWCQRFGLLTTGVMREQTGAGRDNFLKENGFEDVKLETTSPDCSFRTYYRFQADDQNYIVMDAPPPIEDVVPFINMAGFYESIGLRVPHIFAQDAKQAYLLLEDLGKHVLSDVCKDKSLQEKWLNVAVDVLIHTANEKKPNIWGYSAESMWQEAKRFTDWYLPYVTGQATHTADREAFKNAWFTAFESVKNLPQTTCHWDYHVDNLMCLDPQGEATLNNLALIDFQDARVGPVSMDMACLLEDRFPAGESLKQKLIHTFLDGLEQKVSYQDFMAGYNLCLAHRFFKITGLLVRLQERDQRGNVMARMDQVWQTLNQALSHEACAPIKKVMDDIYPQYKEKVA
jgi:tRNA threonylcarbamoyl adenosine modification protein YjeE